MIPTSKILLLLFCLLYLAPCYAQDTVLKAQKKRISDNVVEKFQIIESKPQAREGFYEALYKNKTPVAMGKYTHGKKTGLWRFYTPKGDLLQIYNYNTNTLHYEAPEDSLSSINYYFDRTISDTDKVTRPVKIGGRYYGYLPYKNIYESLINEDLYDWRAYYAQVELLVSPLGRLAEFKVHFLSPTGRIINTIKLDTKLFKDDDKQFIPATYNGTKVLSIIKITCRIPQQRRLF